MITAEKLLNTNKIAAAAHLASFAGVLVLYIVWSHARPHTTAQTYRYTIAGPNQLGPSGCNSDPTGPAPGQCNTNTVFAPPAKMFTYNVIYCVMFFFLFTAAAHMYYATNGFGSGSYLRAIKDGWNPYRWLEYGISASVMSVLIGYSLGVHDGFQLLCLAIITAAMQGCGFIAEASMTRGLKLNPRVLWGSTFAGWLLFVGLWIPLIATFAYLVQDVNDKFKGDIDPNTDRAISVPSWVWFIVIVEFVQYALFGLVQRGHIHGMLTGSATVSSYPKTELKYLMLSFTAKLALAGGLSYGLLWRTHNCPVE
jgi:hypothetical protein